MKHMSLLALMTAAGCTQLGSLAIPVTDAPVVQAKAPVTLDPTPAPPPPPKARTVEQFDTTSAEDRAAALAKPETAGEVKLGETIATLGSPVDPGIWIATPLVDELVMGRVVYTKTGQAVILELRPNGKDIGAGSQISLPAMQLLEAPLTGLLELVVYKQ